MRTPTAAADKAYWLEKGVVLLLFLLSACASPPKWRLETPQGSCSRLSFPTRECYFEIIRSCGTDWGYLNNYTFGFPPGEIEITLIIEGQRYIFIGRVLEGFQRLLLPSEATQLTINALDSNSTVQIIAGNYQTTLHPLNFSDLSSKR